MSSVSFFTAVLLGLLVMLNPTLALRPQPSGPRSSLLEAMPPKGDRYDGGAIPVPVGSQAPAAWVSYYKFEFHSNAGAESSSTEPCDFLLTRQACLTSQTCGWAVPLSGTEGPAYCFEEPRCKGAGGVPRGAYPGWRVECSRGFCGALLYKPSDGRGQEANDQHGSMYEVLYDYVSGESFYAASEPDRASSIRREDNLVTLSFKERFQNSRDDSAGLAFQSIQGHTDVENPLILCGQDPARGGHDDYSFYEPEATFYIQPGGHTAFIVIDAVGSAHQRQCWLPGESVYASFFTLSDSGYYTVRQAGHRSSHGSSAPSAQAMEAHKDSCVPQDSHKARLLEEDPEEPASDKRAMASAAKSVSQSCDGSPLPLNGPDLMSKRVTAHIPLNKAPAEGGFADRSKDVDLAHMPYMHVFTAPGTWRVRAVQAAARGKFDWRVYRLDLFEDSTCMRKVAVKKLIAGDSAEGARRTKDNGGTLFASEGWHLQCGTGGLQNDGCWIGVELADKGHGVKCVRLWQNAERKGSEVAAADNHGARTRAVRVRVEYMDKRSRWKTAAEFSDGEQGWKTEPTQVVHTETGRRFGQLESVEQVTLRGNIVHQRKHMQERKVMFEYVGRGSDKILAAECILAEPIRFFVSWPKPGTQSKRLYSILNGVSQGTYTHDNGLFRLASSGNYSFVRSFEMKRKQDDMRMDAVLAPDHGEGTVDKYASDPSRWFNQDGKIVHEDSPALVRNPNQRGRSSEVNWCPIPVGRTPARIFDGDGCYQDITRGSKDKVRSSIGVYSKDMVALVLRPSPVSSAWEGVLNAAKTAGQLKGHATRGAMTYLRLVDSNVDVKARYGNFGGKKSLRINEGPWIPAKDVVCVVGWDPEGKQMHIWYVKDLEDPSSAEFSIYKNKDNPCRTFFCKPARAVNAKGQDEEAEDTVIPLLGESLDQCGA